MLAGFGVWALGLGALAYAVRVLAAVPRSSGGPDTAVAPRSLDQPWRGAVEQVQDARRRFDDATKGVAEGPLKERLTGVAQHLDTAVAEAWRIARAGHALSKARKQIDTTRIQSELDYARSQPAGGTTQDTIAAMESQLTSAARLDATIGDTHDRLILMDARTDEAVARVIELSVSQIDDHALGELDSDVGSIVGDLEALRLAIEETHGTPTSRGGTTSSGSAP
ncbi:MAG: hypothetical protein M5U19_23415 [Microthrixaceae bacterium]|nr:hypothetical protein [Microthrixaceae bacterium]